MSIAKDTTPIGPGHNLPPEGSEIFTSILKITERLEAEAPKYLASEYADLMRRLKEILATVADGIPSKITDKVEAEKLSDIRFAIKKWVSAAKSARTSEKRPWDALAKRVYSFFTKPIEDLEEIDEKQIVPVINDWQERETARVRREAEAEASRLREEADRKAREAAEAETRRLAAEKAERDAREAAEKAERDCAEEQRRQAEAKASKEQEERDAAEAAKRAEIARKEREEQERLAAVAKAQRQADETASAEARLREEAANKAAANARLLEEAADLQRKQSELRAKAAQAEEMLAKERAKFALAEQKEAERDQVEARKDQRAAGRDEKASFADAERAEKKADKHDDVAGGKAADLSRIRGEHGSVSSLRTFKNFRGLDRKALDLEPLRHLISISAYEAAIRSFIDAGGTELRGVEIFDDTGTTTR